MHFFCEGERRGETFGLWVRLFTVGEREALLRMHRTLLCRGRTLPIEL